MTKALLLIVTVTMFAAAPVASAQGARGGGPPPGPQSVRPPAVTPAPAPADPFAAVKAGTETPQQYQARYRYNAAVDPLDPFHNWGGNLWNQTWQGQWLAARRDGRTFEQFWNSLQGRAGQSLVFASPYPYQTVDEHWGAWRRAANRGAGPANQPATPQDWSGQWGGGGAGNALQRDYYASVSDAYKPRYVMSIQAEIEGRHWWPADSCLPNGYGGAGTFAFRYASFNGPLVHFNNPNPVYEGRYIMVGRDFLPPQQSVPSYMGEAIGFWDGDELVVWTRNLHPNMRGHGEAEHSGEMQMIERYYRRGDNILVDVTRYDPVAYAAPQHTVGLFTRATEFAVPIFNECVSTNNVFHDARGWIADVAPGEPGYKDIFDLTPWYTNWMLAEAAKKGGQAPPAPSILELAPRR